jgi:UDPglucose 6-dehydrogenase
MARMVIVGSGVVGQATGKGFTRKGHLVSYVDVDAHTITRLRAAGLPAGTIEEVQWGDVDLALLTVSTPSVNGRIVLDHIEMAAQQVGEGLACADRYVVVAVRSTVPPTTTERCITPILEQASGKRAGVHFGVAMNPEFLRQSSSEQDFARPWVTVVGSTDPRALALLREIYAPFGARIVECTPTEAEMIKYVNNIYNAVKISYFNEVHEICQHLGIDSNLVGSVVARSAEGMWNPLYGTRGGVPYGGACLPKDTAAFMSWARDHGWEHLILEATMEVNHRLETHVPPAASPEQIDEVLASLRGRGGNAAQETATRGRLIREDIAREILEGARTAPANGANGARVGNDEG